MRNNEQQTETYQAICCVCHVRYGPKTKTVDNSHGYCDPCAKDALKTIAEQTGQDYNTLLARMEEMSR